MVSGQAGLRVVKRGKGPRLEVAMSMGNVVALVLSAIIVMAGLGVAIIFEARMPASGVVRSHAAELQSHLGSRDRGPVQG